MNLIQKSLLITLLLSGSVAFGQITDDPDDRRAQGQDPLRTQTPEGRPLPFGQRLRFGGGINGFRFGNPFSLGVSPVVGYQATEHLILGIGGTYNYTRYKLPIFRPTVLTQLGGRGFAMYEFIPAILSNLYLHGELETTTIQERDEQSNQRVNFGLTTPLIGLTYMQPISRRFGVNLTALYNLNASSNASRIIYGTSPFIVRISFF